MRLHVSVLYCFLYCVSAARVPLEHRDVIRGLCYDSAAMFRVLVVRAIPILTRYRVTSNSATLSITQTLPPLAR
jgi:hypothetical protein